jgi:hypothetical protein
VWTFLLLFSLATTLAFGDESNSVQSLRGWRDFDVIVEKLNPDIQLDGLATEQLRTDVELKLRLAGVHVLNPLGPYLYVNATTLKNERQNSYTYYVSVEFHQPVIRSGDALVDLLGPKWDAPGERPPVSKESVLKLAFGKNSMFATTWSSGTIGWVPSGSVQHIRNTVKDTVDLFLNDWLKVNQKP